jgi:1-aminocyclopropane-1-carboxylate deaminase
LNKPGVSKINLAEQEIDVLRLDLLHPLYGGNKIFKLKRNLEKAKEQGHDTILTFGGAHSNHIFASSAFCKENGLKCIGIIRGEDEKKKVSLYPTLKAAKLNGMQLHFVSREDYGRKEAPNFIQHLAKRFGKFYLVPEGGNNKEGVEGCREIMKGIENKYDHVFCACGTGATFAGIKIAVGEKTIVTGISVLKGKNTLIDEVNKWLVEFGKEKIKEDEALTLKHSSIVNNFHLGGYATYNKELVDFENSFEKETKIPLDHVYTSKLFYAVNDLIKNKKIDPSKKILVIHSGGLQGNEGFEKRFLGM